MLANCFLFLTFVIIAGVCNVNTASNDHYRRRRSDEDENKASRLAEQQAREKKERWDALCSKTLTRFGYLQGNESTDNATMKEALKRFQCMAGVQETGEMNDETEEAMTRRRCGVPDEFPGDSHHRTRVKRFTTVLDWKWRRRHLSYRITGYSTTSPLGRAGIDNVMSRAFSYWAAETSLTFTNLNCNPVDMEISFPVRNHGDGEDIKFDGPNGILAHAFFPYCTNNPYTHFSYCGDIHFDGDERWINGFSGGIGPTYQVL